MLGEPECSTSHGVEAEVAAHHHRHARRRRAPARRAAATSRRGSRPARSCASGPRSASDAAGATVAEAGGHGSILTQSGLVIDSQSWDSGLHGPAPSPPPASPPCSADCPPQPRPTAASPTRLRLLIADGRMPAGTRLPSERELTERARRQPHHRHPGVRRAARARLPRRPAAARAPSPGCPRPGRAAPTTTLLLPGAGRDGRRHRPHLRGRRRAPPGVVAAYERAVAELPAVPRRRRLLPLRPAGAARGDRRAATPPAACPPTPDQVIVTAGRAGRRRVVAARAFAGPGDRVLVETPTYPNAIAALRARRAPGWPAPPSTPTAGTSTRSAPRCARSAPGGAT